MTWKQLSLWCSIYSEQNNHYGFITAEMQCLSISAVFIRTNSVCNVCLLNGFIAV